MQEHKTPRESYRSFLLCVDSYDRGVFTGHLVHPRIGGGGLPFHSLVEALRKMEAIMDEVDFPQAYTVKRVFAPLHESLDEAPENTPPGMGRKGTFLVRILFRRHASWQGIVTWVERKDEQRFRSVLELILLMDSALEARPKPDRDGQNEG